MKILHDKKFIAWIVLAAVVACFAVAACFLTSPKKEDETVQTPPSQERQEVQENNRGEQASAASGNEDAILKLLEDWQRVFCARDAEAIASMVAPELADKLLMGTEGNYSFGWSSPWPWDDSIGAALIDHTEESAVIYYYAMTSDPHVTCWKETLEYKWENDRYVITDEELICYDKIATGAEFQDAYHGTINESMMDYTSNGFGEQLNENALLNSSTAYQDLFEPKSAAAFLLNLSDEPEKVELTLHEREGIYVGLDILFLEDRETFTISMTQPFGQNGIWVPVDYQIDVIARFRKVDREKLRALPFDANVISFEDILCIGETPEKNARIYGYNDEEVGARGVAIEMEFPTEGREIYYYDWYYVTPRGILPDLYWDEAKERLSMACTIYTGTGVDAQELHILQRYGTMQETSFSLDEYTTLLEKRIDWQFEEDTRKLTLTDKKTGETLAELTVPTDVGERVTGLELGMISKFILGNEIRFVVSPGYYIDDMYGIAQYEEMPELCFELLLTNGKNGHFDFALGELVALGEPVK